MGVVSLRCSHDRERVLRRSNDFIKDFPVLCLRFSLLLPWEVGCVCFPICHNCKFSEVSPAVGKCESIKSRVLKYILSNLGQLCIVVSEWTNTGTEKKFYCFLNYTFSHLYVTGPRHHQEGRYCFKSGFCDNKYWGHKEITKIV